MQLPTRSLPEGLTGCNVEAPRSGRFRFVRAPRVAFWTSRSGAIRPSISISWASQVVSNLGECVDARMVLIAEDGTPSFGHLSAKCLSEHGRLQLLPYASRRRLMSARAS